jgi:ABC-type transport system involved in multi-copper enzyme maturation permease subunit
VTGVLRAELLKLRTTRRTLGLAVGMVALVIFVVLLHGLLLPATRATANDEMHVFGWGQLGALFAGLLGALSVTAELRNGTIRPTFLATPRRSRVIAAKVVAAALAGILVGIAAEALTIGLGVAVLAARGIPIRLDGGDYAQLVLGGTAAAAFWAPLGLGLGALLRNQVATIVGLCAWLLFVENLLIGQLPGLGRYLPGAVGAAIGGGSTITGEVPTNPALLAPALGALLLVAYAATATAAGMAVTDRHDVL